MDIEYKLYGFGVSMGANLLLKYCGITGKECKFDAVMSWNNPFDLWLATNLMRKNLFEGYLVPGTVKHYFMKAGLIEEIDYFLKAEEEKKEISSLTIQ